MCRVLSYLGKPILIDDLLFKPDSSLIRQMYDARLTPVMLNLAGFGMASWNEASYNLQDPFIYKTTNLAFHDKNLKDFSEKLQSDCLIAHIRGVLFNMGQNINQENLHPFLFEGCDLALAHNGELAGFKDLKSDLFHEMKPEIAAKVAGSTDSELIYALLMSQFDDPYAVHTPEEVCEAVMETFHTIDHIRKKRNHFGSSPLNLFISNGKYLVVTRFVFNFGTFIRSKFNPNFYYHSLWYTYGEEYGLYDGEYKMKGNKKRSVIFASEPLTRDVTTWIPVPEYSLVTAQWDGEEININSYDMDI